MNSLQLRPGPDARSRRRSSSWVRICRQLGADHETAGPDSHAAPGAPTRPNAHGASHLPVEEGSYPVQLSGRTDIRRKFLSALGVASYRIFVAAKFQGLCEIDT